MNVAHTFRRRVVDRPDSALAFLPSALSVIENPPSPIGRIILWSLTCLVCIAVAWAYLGEVDIVVMAPGKVVPRGQTKIVQAPEDGSVATIHVKEGEVVSAGQRLVSLDPIFASADLESLNAQLTDTQAQIQWREAFEVWFSSDHLSSETRLHPDVSYLGLLDQHTDELGSRLESFDQEINANLAALKSLDAEYDKIQSTLTILKQRVGAFRTLVEKNYGPKLQYLELLQQETDLDAKLPIVRAKKAQLASEIQAIRSRRKAVSQEARKDNLLQLVSLRQSEQRLQKELEKASERENRLEIHAPVSGAVQELQVHTVGAVVTAAQPLLNIVPDSTFLEVEATLKNQDVGFVQDSQRAVVKVDTFNFTKYGLIEAKIIDISDDAIEGTQGEWLYKMRLKLESDAVQVEGRQVPIMPGMSVTAEVITGKRRLIEYVLSPLLRYRAESVRER